MNSVMIHNIVRASGVTAGENVLIHFWGEDESKGVANEFVAATASLGATPVLLQQSRTVNRAIFEQAKEECYGEAYFEAFSRFDAVLDVFAYQPIVLGCELEPEQMALYRRYIAKLFYALMKAKRFTQIRIPTAANAEESGLEPDDYIQRMEAAYGIDYDMLMARCAAAKAKMEEHSRWILHTGENCRLCFDLTEREWHVDAGDGDWPCGEIYIAPNETKTNGTVFFETLYLEDRGVFENVTLTVESGMVVSADPGEVDAFIRGLPPENRVVCELGLGMNPGVTSLCGYTVLDEKMAGSFHIALGANQMFGGKNEAKMHMDLVHGGRFELGGI